MARSDITTQDIPRDGLNITDMSTTLMTTGPNNGVMVVHEDRVRLLLRNPTAGTAVYTLKTPTPADYSSYGLTIPDETISVAAGKDFLYTPTQIFIQPDKKLYVDCDVAARIASIRT